MTTCHRAVIRDGIDEPCDLPATGIAWDAAWGTYYPVCRRHDDDRRLPFLLHRRPELAGIGVAVVAEVGKANA